MTVYTEGPVPTDTLQVGDIVAIEHAALWGPVVAIRDYVATPPLSTPQGWRYAVFATGAEVTMAPGGSWFPR